MNKAARQKRKKEEMARIRTLVGSYIPSEHESVFIFLIFVRLCLQTMHMLVIRE